MLEDQVNNLKEYSSFRMRDGQFLLEYEYYSYDVGAWIIYTAVVEVDNRSYRRGVSDFVSQLNKFAEEVALIQRTKGAYKSPWVKKREEIRKETVQVETTEIT